MHPFTYQRLETIAAASTAARLTDAARLPPVQAPVQFIAGGTNMSDYMRLGVMQPSGLVDLNGLVDRSLRQIEVSADGIRFGALVRMSEAEEHPEVKARYPVLQETLKLAASRQTRNMATLGGNVLQRTRCEYFREVSWPCNKRNPGSGCSALHGVNRQHALFGTSENCIATYHGDFAQALIALDAQVDIVNAEGLHTIAFADLHVEPGDMPNVETVLAPGDVIVSLFVPAGAYTARSHYLKIRDRQSYAFALASAAVALDLDGDVVRNVRIALGGVATVPWRALEAEDALRGKPLDEAAAIAAAEAAFVGAVPREYNGFKVPLGKRTLVRALLETRDMVI